MLGNIIHLRTPCHLVWARRRPGKSIVKWGIGYEHSEKVPCRNNRVVRNKQAGHKGTSEEPAYKDIENIVHLRIYLGINN